MIVTLIGKNTIYKTKLPKIASGNYWIIGENNKKLVNIESNNGYWTIKSNNHIKIINPKEVVTSNISQLLKKSNNLTEQIVLKEYDINYIKINDFKDEIFVIYCEPIYESNYTQLKRKKQGDIFIGRGNSNTIIYDNPFIKQIHARIFYSNGKLMIENYDTEFGTFVNNVPIKKVKLLFNGDVIFIMGLKIIILGENILVNNPYDSVSYNKGFFDIAKNKQRNMESLEEDDSDIELYSQNDYFTRAPRITNIIEKEKVKIDKPPENQNKEDRPLIYVLGPTIGMGAMMLMSTISTITGIQGGTASRSRIVFSVITAILMLICMILFPILSVRYDKNKKIKKEKTRQERYKKYVNSKIEQIEKLMTRQKRILYENYISAEECAKIIISNSPRLWERKIDDPDFLKIRVGVGDLPSEIDIDYPEMGFTMEDDNLIDNINTIVKKSKTLKNVPITISLLEKNISGVIIKNDNKLVEKFVQNLVMQLITLQSYDDLKLVFFMKEDKNKKWEHLKTLPHIWDDYKQFRFWAEKSNDMQTISRYLEPIFMNRASQNERNNDNKVPKPYYLIITDDYKKIENLRIISQILKERKNIGFGIFCITDNLLDLPNECQSFINIENNKGTMFENKLSMDGKKEFLFDSSYTFFFEWIGKKLSNIPIKFTANSSNFILPTSYSFLQMYDAGKIEQLNILERWKTNDSTVSLQAPIGIDSSGMPIALDIHEKYHGPHGLIAGSTGSGKSEFIITYILSLAINYHPDDVTVILIDYKGGGLAGAFAKKEVKLPHLVGTITNIDTVGLQRSLDSIQSELRRRQILFNKARDQIDEGTIDIYKYQKLYHDGMVKEPIPHLLIICDEFAELKQQQPDFMTEIISVARIGRSLGVHLILATQKPAGVVNDQIRSNSKFGICLKVQAKEDSMDVINRPDAANLKRPGEFYMQVGNDEYFTLGKSAYSGAPYIPTDIVKKTVDNSIKFISNIGTVIKEVDMSKKQKLNVKGEQLTSIVKYMYELAKKEKINARPLWMENIPANIFINEVKKKYKINKVDKVIKPVIGEFDDPYNQRQGVVQLNLSEQGNTVIYGNAESGKETLLSTLIYDVMTTYTANEIQMYIIDFGSEALKIFKGSPVVGDITFASDIEKIERLFEMIQTEIRLRTSILSDYGGDYNLYINNESTPMPMIVIIINSFESFLENYENKYDDILLTLTRDGVKYGINFIVTVSGANDLRYRLAQNFRQKIILQLNNNDDYVNILDVRTKKRPSKIFGRGLVRYEDVYEFQTARICEATQWNKYIKETIVNLKKTSKVIAKCIPVLPDVVRFENVKENLTDIMSVPVGIEKKNIEVYTYNFKKNFMNIITGKNIDVVSEFARQIFEEMNKLENVKIILLDAERIIQTNKNTLKSNYQDLKSDINNNSNKGKDVVCIILGIDKFLNDLENGENEFLATLNGAESLENYNFIIMDIATKLKNFGYTNWYKKYNTGDSGIWIGNGVRDQYLLTTNVSSLELDNRCGDSFGYAIVREEPKLIKLLGMKDKGDEDG